MCIALSLISDTVVNHLKLLGLYLSRVRHDIPFYASISVLSFAVNILPVIRCSFTHKVRPRLRNYFIKDSRRLAV